MDVWFSIEEEPKLGLKAEAISVGEEQPVTGRSRLTLEPKKEYEG